MTQKRHDTKNCTGLIAFALIRSTLTASSLSDEAASPVESAPSRAEKRGVSRNIAGEGVMGGAERDILTGARYEKVYQRIRFAPQVRPPPQAFSITMLFSLMRPFSIASSSAIGTDAAEVLP